MKEKFICYTIQQIENTRDISSLERKRLRYGLEGFYNLFTKTIVMLFLAVLFHLLPQLLLLILIYSTFRLYGFGIHAKTSLQCWLTTLPIYIGGSFLIKYVTFSQPIIYIIWIFGFVSFLLFAPADTDSRPLIHKGKRIRAKVLSLLILTGYYLANTIYHNSFFLNTTLYALLVESFSINPLIYKLFHASFNNYKTYQKTTV